MPEVLKGRRVAVAGSLAYDYLSEFGGAFEDVLLADKLHELSVCFFVPKKTRHFGGTSGNIAYNLALLEEPSTVVGVAGSDFGPYEAWLIQKGISLDHVGRVDSLPTASATIITDLKGHQIAEFYPGAMGEMVPLKLEDAFGPTDYVLISPDDPRRMLECLKEAQRLEKRYFFDPGQNLPLFTKEQLMGALRGAAGVFFNDYEWDLFHQKTDLSVEACLAAAPLWIITQGEKGSTLFTKDEVGQQKTIVIPPVLVDKTVNPTGCGDAYRAAFLKGLILGHPLEVCGRMGALLASYVVVQQATQQHETTWLAFKSHYASLFETSL